MKTIGVLGGLGPQATTDFETRIHRVAQSLIEPQRSTGYPPMVVYFHRSAPMKTGPDFKPILPLQADPALLGAARRLGEWADFIVVVSNTPHLFLPDIQRAASCPVLNMVTLTLAEVERRQWRTVGVLEVGDPRIYPPPLAARGVDTKTADAEIRAELGEEIWRVMEGRDGEGSKAALGRALTNVRGKGVDGIILGCTEIPLLLSEDAKPSDLINPAQLLAEAAVRYALRDG